MRVIRWIESKLFTGEVLRDYGVLDQRRMFGMRLRTSLLLCRRRGRYELVLRSSAYAVLGASVNYSCLAITPELIEQLKEVVMDTEQIALEEESA
jgi:hypothetical protein